ncbi:CcoQ/FixQ family Cbb3-type cytochrome c oxidase assembly chaperone [Flavobacterium sp.]|uniref:CcoQ/FixQ family Cbb3-type cytochrome c oxidase assembly chaperone n=1 Tax=Flavobacterium sp. TaxID=239 RepID=UPI00261D0BB2|nr:CcoQ/FixQ family Cbb3-type cytochrome c oxidase assembly chaperone [Flavobacterium sp.]
MLKFVKHNLETIAGVEIYPIISLSIFFTAFVLFTVWAMTYSKETLNTVSNLPLNDNESLTEKHHF